MAVNPILKRASDFIVLHFKSAAVFTFLSFFFSNGNIKNHDGNTLSVASNYNIIQGDSMYLE